MLADSSCSCVLNLEELLARLFWLSRVATSRRDVCERLRASGLPRVPSASLALIRLDISSRPVLLQEMYIILFRWLPHTHPLPCLFEPPLCYTHAPNIYCILYSFRAMWKVVYKDRRGFSRLEEEEKAWKIDWLSCSWPLARFALCSVTAPDRGRWIIQDRLLPYSHWWRLPLPHTHTYSLLDGESLCLSSFALSRRSLRIYIFIYFWMNHHSLDASKKERSRTPLSHIIEPIRRSCQISAILRQDFSFLPLGSFFF